MTGDSGSFSRARGGIGANPPLLSPPPTARHPNPPLQTNPAVRCVGVSFNTSGLEAGAATRLLDETTRQMGVPTTDPLREGVSVIVDQLCGLFGNAVDNS